MDRIEIGDIFVEQDRREHGRMLRVIAVFSKLAYGPAVDDDYVACTSRGRVTVLSEARLMDSSRFERVPHKVGQLSFEEVHGR